MKAGTCYELSLQLARSQYYVSLSRSTQREVNYTVPAVIRMWGGNEKYCNKEELLIETEPIKNKDWQETRFVLEPTNDYEYIMIKVYYKPDALKAYNGNVIVDNLSELVPMPCDDN